MPTIRFEMSWYRPFLEDAIALYLEVWSPFFVRRDRH